MWNERGKAAEKEQLDWRNDDKAVSKIYHY